MKKKAILGGIALLAVAAGMTGVAAFEAHVINVTAKIENALFAHPESRDFGTMFPQEFRELGFNVVLSQSFSETSQTRVTKVDYVIKQKPKCADSVENPVEFSRVTENEAGEFVCENAQHVPLPLLCPYLSKTPGSDLTTTTGVLPFHDPFDPANFATGTIDKFSGHDVGHIWIVDLAVPCFEGQCSQDWDEFVRSHNPAADPDEFRASPEDEGKVFGCDLWVEVTGIR